MFRKWVLYSTLLSIYCSRFLVVIGGMTFFISYFVILFNLVLLTVRGYLWTPGRLRWFFAYLFGSGILGLILGTNSSVGFFKSIVGILIYALYSAAFIRFFRFQAVTLFEYYARFAYYAAIFGLLFFPFQPYSKDRLTSVFLEPSSFCIVCVPAIFFYVDEWQRNRRYGVRLLTLCVALVLTFSSLGFLGLLLGGILFSLRYRWGRMLTPGILFVVFTLLFNNSEMFQERMSDTFVGVSEGDVTNINQSSLGVVANMYVTQRQFAEHPILGGGLGSHIVAHQRFIEDLPGVMLLTEAMRNLGQWDASSLFLRIVSELGIVGVLGALWYLWYYFPRRGTPQERAVSMALLCYVFMKFLRSGEYFAAEQFFFLSIYTIVGVTSRLRLQAAARTNGIAAQPLLPVPAVSMNISPAESH